MMIQSKLLELSTYEFATYPSFLIHLRRLAHENQTAISPGLAITADVEFLHTRKEVGKVDFVDRVVVS